MKPYTLHIWGPECSICKVANCPENATEILDVWMNCPVVTCQKKPPIDTTLIVECGKLDKGFDRCPYKQTIYF
jgi:hypothetical protein